MDLEQAYAMANFAAQLGILYVFGGAVCFALTIFLLVTAIAGALGAFTGPVRSNCMLEAYKHYRRGAYLVMHKTRFSRGWRWPHMGWSYDGKVWSEYIPFKRPRRWFPAILFEGYVHQWSPAEDNEHAE